MRLYFRGRNERRRFLDSSGQFAAGRYFSAPESLEESMRCLVSPMDERHCSTSIDSVQPTAHDNDANFEVGPIATPTAHQAADDPLRGQNAKVLWTMF